MTYGRPHPSVSWSFPTGRLDWASYRPASCREDFSARDSELCGDGLIRIAVDSERLSWPVPERFVIVSDRTASNGRHTTQQAAREDV